MAESDSRKHSRAAAGNKTVKHRKVDRDKDKFFIADAEKDHTEYSPLAIINLYRILYEYTDENYGMSEPELEWRLAKKRTYLAKQTIEKYLRLMTENTDFGLRADIQQPGNGGRDGFCMLSRELDVNEVKMLADAVASAKFITDEEAFALINKLKRFVSVHQAKELNRQVYVADRVRSKNDKTMHNIDWIHKAIADRNDPDEIPRKIEFDYYEYDINKKLIRRGEHRICTPYALAWSDDRYYLVASHPDYSIVNYRVDRMDNIRMTDLAAAPLPKYYSARNGDTIAFDLPKYLSTTFSMFSGNKEENVKLMFDKSLVNVVLDKFGHDTRISPSQDKESFTVTISVKVEHPEPFFAWLVNFGRRVRFIGPADLKARYLDYLKDIIEANG